MGNYKNALIALGVSFLEPKTVLNEPQAIEQHIQYIKNYSLGNYIPYVNFKIKPFYRALRYKRNKKGKIMAF